MKFKLKKLTIALTIILTTVIILNSTGVITLEYSATGIENEIVLYPGEQIEDAGSGQTGRIGNPDIEPIYDAEDDPVDITRASLPTGVDLSTGSYFPCIRNQGSIGSCVCWATTYYQFGYQVARLKSWNATSNTYYQFSPKWTYNYINNGVNGPSNENDAYNILKSQGAVRYSQFTPTGVNTDSEYRAWCLNTSYMTNALQYKVSDFSYYSFADTDATTPITAYNDSDLTNIKNYLNTGHILTAATKMTTWITDTATNGTTVVKRLINSSNAYDHLVSIVGYNDNISCDLNNNGTIENFEKGAFKIANSWGTDWGDSGFRWIMYDALNEVSNATAQNTTNRHKIFEKYAYYKIEVAEYPFDLVAEVTINQKLRDDIKIRLDSSAYPNLSYQSSQIKCGNTMFLYGAMRHGGPYNFTGSGTTAQTKTFVFDYSQVFDMNSLRRYCFLEVNKYDLDRATTISSIKLIDSSNKIVVNDTTTKTITSDYYKCYYKLGVLGDINNDGSISLSDVTMLQQHISHLITLSSDDLKVADVNGDGNANSSDVTVLQNYISGIITVFPNGKIVYLS